LSQRWCRQWVNFIEIESEPNIDPFGFQILGADCGSNAAPSHNKICQKETATQLDFGWALVDALGSMLQMSLNRRWLHVGSRRRTFNGIDANYSASAMMCAGVGAWRVTELTAKFSCEMSIVTEAAGIGNLAERLACVQQRPAMQKARGVIQTKRIDEFTARRAALRKELLKIA
jgi:hypothetical protein